MPIARCSVDEGPYDFIKAFGPFQLFCNYEIFIKQNLERQREKSQKILRSFGF